MEKVIRFQMQKFRLKVLLSFWLIISQCQPVVAYKSVAYSSYFKFIPLIKSKVDIAELEKSLTIFGKCFY